VKARFGLPAIKAIGVATENDVRKAKEFAAADICLFDAKPAPARGFQAAREWFSTGVCCAI